MTRPKGQPMATSSRIPYTASRPWTGIYTDQNALCSCTWGYKDDETRPQIKFRHAACTVHGGASRG